MKSSHYTGKDCLSILTGMLLIALGTVAAILFIAFTFFYLDDTEHPDVLDILICLFFLLIGPALLYLGLTLIWRPAESMHIRNLLWFLTELPDISDIPVANAEQIRWMKEKGLLTSENHPLNKPVSTYLFRNFIKQGFYAKSLLSDEHILFLRLDSQVLILPDSDQSPCLWIREEVFLHIREGFVTAEDISSVLGYSPRKSARFARRMNRLFSTDSSSSDAGN